MDFATPDEPTIALLRHLAHLGLVATAAAQQPAAVHPPAGLVAQATRCSQYAKSEECEGAGEYTLVALAVFFLFGFYMDHIVPPSP